ncbi:uncharacterized protein LOC112272373 isoform X2 [Brachypodium distachyon]|uniref:Uncharacterized protein n=1 Tax=Brachypodium distachyon TaxID=15368 RepID=A0A2K2CNR3_BRADI|nr:uncharacterized protein LOC112272373 isoform X2 [Brachypodium distachyon]PNT63687.1 hypothetical protein BRADI_4g20077v3 [Brachypodium distachyon]|eukprot:XP_024318753.1 uncharacterized protein LOC112272373 isoform X2 [Brachypodium distachyon]
MKKDRRGVDGEPSSCGDRVDAFLGSSVRSTTNSTFAVNYQILCPESQLTWKGAGVHMQSWLVVVEAIIAKGEKKKAQMARLKKRITGLVAWVDLNSLLLADRMCGKRLGRAGEQSNMVFGLAT